MDNTDIWCYTKTIEKGAALNKPQTGGRHTGEKPRERSIYARRRPAPAQNKQEVSHMSSREMENKARELRQLQALIDEAQQEAEAIRDALKAAMGDAEAVTAGEYRITWKRVTSSRIDTGALKKAMPEVAAAFTKETTVRRFCVA